MPAKGKSKLGARQLAAIAAGKASGRKNREIAAAAGVSESTVQHHARDPRVMTLIEHLEVECAEELKALYRALIRALRKDVDARSGGVSRGARAQALQLLTAGARVDLVRVRLAGRSAADAGESGAFYLEELLYQRARRMEDDPPGRERV